MRVRSAGSFPADTLAGAFRAGWSRHTMDLTAFQPVGAPGAFTDQERFLFDVAGYLVIPNALSPAEVEGLLEAARPLTQLTETR